MNPVRAGGDGVRFPRQASNNGAGNPEPVCRDVPELHDSDLEALERDFPGVKENCSTGYKGESPQDDLMEMLLKKRAH